MMLATSKHVFKIKTCRNLLKNSVIFYLYKSSDIIKSFSLFHFVKTISKPNMEHSVKFEM